MNGGCLCGAVRYRIDGEPSTLCYCHCTSCRRATGAIMVAWATVPRSNFAITKGELHEVASSPGVTRGFCGACGSSLTYRHERRKDDLDVTVATLDDTRGFEPTVHIWVKDKLPWVKIGDGLRQYETVIRD